MEFEIYRLSHKKEIRTNNLRILGEEFVKNNRNKGQLVIDNKKIALQAVISNYNFKQNKMKMILCKNIYNKSCMFKNCDSLESILRISNYECNEILSKFENDILNEFEN